MGFKVSVSGNIKDEKYATTLSTKDHTIISDEPISYGGQNKGFNPFELLASSLASCTLITLRLYVERKKWEVPEILIDVDFESFPKENTAIFRRYIDFKGATLTHKQKERLLQIAEKCPVHKVLENKMEIFSEIKSDVIN